MTKKITKLEAEAWNEDICKFMESLEYDNHVFGHCKQCGKKIENLNYDDEYCYDCYGGD